MLGPTNAAMGNPVEPETLLAPVISQRRNIVTIIDNSKSGATQGYKVYVDGVLVDTIPIR